MQLSPSSPLFLLRCLLIGGIGVSGPCILGMKDTSKSDPAEQRLNNIRLQRDAALMSLVKKENLSMPLTENITLRTEKEFWQVEYTLKPDDKKPHCASAHLGKAWKIAGGTLQFVPERLHPTYKVLQTAAEINGRLVCN